MDKESPKQPPKDKAKLPALKAHLSEGAEQAENNEFVKNFSMDDLIIELDVENQ